MRFKLKKNISENDISIANISVSRIRSEHIVNITDYSTKYTNNTVPIMREITSGVDTQYNDIFSNTYRLSKFNTIGDILLTNEYHYSINTGQKTPLYYKHTIANPIFTRAVIKRSITYKVTSIPLNGIKIKGLIPRDSDNIIPINSIIITNSSNNNIPYHFDYGSGEIVIKNYVNLNDELLIQYLLVDNTFTIENTSGSIYRISLEKLYKDSNEYFKLEIFSTSRSPYKIKYLKPETDNRSIEVEEYTNGFILYNQVSKRVRELMVINNIKGERVYSIDSMNISPIGGNIENYIIIPFSNESDVFTFKAKDTSSSKISMEIRPNLNYSQEWFPTVKTGSFSHNGIIFKIEDSGHRFKTVVDEPIIVTSKIISLSYKNIISPTDQFGNHQWISIYDKDNKEKIIERIDLEKSLIYLKEPIKMDEQLKAELVIINNDVELSNISLNPLSGINQDIDITQMIIVFLMIPDTDTEYSRYSPIYSIALPRYTKEGIENYTFNDLDKIVNDISPEAIRYNIPNLPSTFIDNASEFIILATMYVSNPIDEDGYLLEDARVYGGGNRKAYGNYYDIAFYDGEKTDLNTIIHMYIKQSIYDDLYSRVIEYDREVLKHRGDNKTMEQIAKRRTMEVLNEKIEKFLPVGCEWEVIIESN